jgi:glutathione S-transferase
MLILYHYPLCPISRLIRVILSEQNVEYKLEKIDFWRERQKIISLDPLGEIPALKTNENKVIVGFYPLIEYVSSLSPNFYFSNLDNIEAAEMRRIIYWLDYRFNKEITSYVVSEKLVRLLSKDGSPRTEFLRAARINLIHHMNYFQTLFSRNGNIATHQQSIADLFLACHISVLDYFGEINWEKFAWIKDWYATIKSRPSFRKILQDRVPIINPPSHYEDPDF